MSHASLAGHAPAAESRCLLRVRGDVQGVGFRPFVYREALSLGLRGGIWNEPDAVVIDLEGEPSAIESLVRRLRTRAPARSRVDAVERYSLAPQGVTEFRIHGSGGARQGEIRIVPDLATCDACLAELHDPRDRRFRYPFTSCTDCGPRYSIARDVPFDRERTSMSVFAPCRACADEYVTVGSRRFHAQAHACPECGPQVWLEPGFEAPGDVVARAARALAEGRILAVKGLGGFQLACDASAPEVVRRLRERKQRPAKPFAVMFPDLASLAREAVVGAAERAALCSPRAPIVLLRRRAGSRLAAEVAPGLAELGAFLPCTPLHGLLLEAFGGPLVMTSGNLSDEPLAASNAEARARLSRLADHLLLHDREIDARVDDSIVRVSGQRERVLRRARGYVPEVFDLGFETPPVLAVGADLKNTLCLTAGRSALLSPHLGDLGCFEVQQLFQQTRANLSRLFGIEPRQVAHDLHPAYHSTRLALETGLPRVAVGHHHAHVAACLVEHAWREPVIGVAWDGTGYGDDGSVWGGEFLVASLEQCRRLGRLRPVALPGGSAAVREPWRMALSHLLAAGLPGDRLEVRERSAVERLLRGGAYAPLTSSAGRLFDAVAALLGVRTHASYEGQAACELQALSRHDAATYAFPVRRGERGLLELDPRPLVRGVVQDLERGVAVPDIGGRFHATLARGITAMCERIREETGLATVVLTGGCFQNPELARLASAGLAGAGFRVLQHERVPPGDGGIALGQAAVAAARGRHVSGDSR